jgi:DegV family protein with EDD domain
MSEPTVRIVVDSTADIPPALVAELGIVVVPLTVHFGAEHFRDGVDLTPAEFIRRLTTSSVMPTTAQPAPTAFTAAYQPLLASGASIISLHISASLSGTYNSAVLAAQELTGTGARIDVVDSRTAAMACGLVAVAAARAARAGATHEAVLAQVRTHLQHIHLFFALDTLEYLQRGGRIGRARALVGSLLSIKPVLTVTDGVVTPLEQARTRQKAIARVIERSRALAERGIEALAVLHSADPETASGLRTALADLVPADRLLVAEIGAVVATYTGPRAAGVAALTTR